MAKKAKRLLVLFLTVVLCVVSVITPATAENTEDPAPVENSAPAGDPTPDNSSDTTPPRSTLFQ